MVRYLSLRRRVRRDKAGGVLAGGVEVVKHEGGDRTGCGGTGGSAAIGGLCGGCGCGL